jgi:hypothetical protein
MQYNRERAVQPSVIAGYVHSLEGCQDAIDLGISSPGAVNVTMYFARVWTLELVPGLRGQKTPSASLSWQCGDSHTQDHVLRCNRQKVVLGRPLVLSQEPCVKALRRSLLEFVVGLGRRDDLQSSPPRCKRPDVVSEHDGHPLGHQRMSVPALVTRLFSDLDIISRAQQTSTLYREDALMHNVMHSKGNCSKACAKNAPIQQYTCILVCSSSELASIEPVKHILYSYNVHFLSYLLLP